jgi:hypothetical protein
MRRQHLVVNVADGTQAYVDMTPEEEAAQEAYGREYAHSERLAADRVAFVTALEPDEVLREKIRTGAEMTAEEVQQVARWLAARQMVEELIR